MRLHHYSIHTERTYCDWIKKFVQFHGIDSRDDLYPCPSAGRPWGCQPS
ncbi:MAG: phage integrase N-terminal SAM-like domain-containing protein [Pseudomonadota bacterium]